MKGAEHSFRELPDPEGPVSSALHVRFTTETESFVSVDYIQFRTESSPPISESGFPAQQGSAGSTSQVPFTTGTQARKTSETTFLGCIWQDLQPTQEKQRAQHMQKFKTEKKTGMSTERVRHWRAEGCVRGEGKGMESILGPLLVAKVLIPKVENLILFLL